MPKQSKKILKKGPKVENAALKGLRARVAKAPQDPGVYRWLNKEGDVLYVGKAKNLRKRLASYVKKDAGANEGPWKRSFLAQITDVDVTVVNSELEALLLETNLIKQLMPKYNVLMKDDKNYLFIRVTVKEHYPRVDAVRRLIQDGSKFFGPYLSTDRVYTILDLLHEATQYRACKNSLDAWNRHPDGSAVRGPCLESQIGRCNGLCAGLITREEYLARIDRVMDFLKGKEEPVIKRLQEKMKEAAANRKFELATKLRDGLKVLEGKEERQLAADGSGEDTDIIGVAILSNRAHVVILHRRDGRIVGESAHALAGVAQSPASVLEQFLPQFYDGREVPPQILIPEEMESVGTMEELLRQWRNGAVHLLAPERGKKSKLLELAEKNAANKARQAEIKWETEERNTQGALSDLQTLLSLPTLPKRIEGYDISHLGGTETVGSMVVAMNGKPANDQYRSFTIQSLKSGMIDDYRSLKEVLTRRLKHLGGGLKRDEELWAKAGVVIRKVKKAERPAVAEFLEMSTESLEESDVLAAWKGEEIVGTVRLHANPTGLLEVRSLRVAPMKHAEGLGHLLLRSALRPIKKGRVYVVCHPAMEQRYGQAGFRHVLKAPPALSESIARIKTDISEDPLTMVYDASQGKADVSLSATPDLLVIDGGKGQLSSVVEVLRALELEIPVIGLAKREEDVFVPGTPVPVLFPPDSPAKFLLMRLRDEAHRFSNRHREKRIFKHSKESVIDTIPGFGDETRIALIKRFGSVDVINSASDEELKEILSDDQITALRRAFE